MTDVTIEDHGSIKLFRLHTEAAEEWVETNVSDEAQFFGGALAVEDRFVATLAIAMADDGLEIE